MFLYWLAHAASYRVVSLAFDIPKSTVHDIVHRISRAVIGILRRVIVLLTPDDLEEVGSGFAQLAGSPAFRMVAGAIDGCHIRIKPPASDAPCYFNRKLFHSVQLQAITDHKGKFVDIFVGYPGSVHDARVLKNSPLYTGRLYPPAGKCILGDGGYPCLHAVQCSTTSAFRTGTFLIQRLWRILPMTHLNPKTQKPAPEKMCGTIWLQLCPHQTTVCLLSISMITCKTI